MALKVDDVFRRTGGKTSNGKVAYVADPNEIKEMLVRLGQKPGKNSTEERINRLGALIDTEPKPENRRTMWAHAIATLKPTKGTQSSLSENRETRLAHVMSIPPLQQYFGHTQPLDGDDDFDDNRNNLVHTAKRLLQVVDAISNNTDPATLPPEERSATPPTGSAHSSAHSSVHGSVHGSAHSSAHGSNNGSRAPTPVPIPPEAIQAVDDAQEAAARALAFKNEAEAAYNNAVTTTTTSAAAEPYATAARTAAINARAQVTAAKDAYAAITAVITTKQPCTDEDLNVSIAVAETEAHAEKAEQFADNTENLVATRKATEDADRAKTAALQQAITDAITALNAQRDQLTPLVAALEAEKNTITSLLPSTSTDATALSTAKTRQSNEYKTAYDNYKAATTVPLTPPGGDTDTGYTTALAEVNALIDKGKTANRTVEDTISNYEREVDRAAKAGADYPFTDTSDIASKSFKELSDDFTTYGDFPIYVGAYLLCERDITKFKSEFEADLKVPAKWRTNADFPKHLEAWAKNHM